MPPQGPRASRTSLVALAAALPILFYFAALYHLSVPVPILDDFNATLNFLTEQSHLHTLPQRLASILQFQHGDYRWVFPHALFAAQYALSGHPNFSIYILAGNIFMLPAAWLLWLNTFPNERFSRRAALFLPVVYLLFQFTYVEMLDFPVAGVQFLILPFTLASMHFLLRPRSVDLLWACLFAVLACATSPQGFFLAPIGVALLLPARNYRRIAAWSLTLLFTLAVYLHGYRPTPHPPLSVYVSSPVFFLSFVGAGIENMHHQPIPYASVVLGVLLCLTFAHSVRTRYYKSHPFLFAAAVWCYMTGVLITYARVGFGLQQSLSVRYKLFCTVLLALAYLYWAHRVLLRPDLPGERKRTLYRAALGASILFCVAADVVGYRFLSQRHDRILDAFAFYRADPTHNAPYINFQINGRDNGEALFERDVLNSTVRSGLYVPPQLPPVPPR